MMIYSIKSSAASAGPMHVGASLFDILGDGPFGGGEEYRALLTYLDGGGSARFWFATAEFEDAVVFD